MGYRNKFRSPYGPRGGHRVSSSNTRHGTALGEAALPLSTRDDAILAERLRFALAHP